jgi:hypothetical protein
MGGRCAVAMTWALLIDIAYPIGSSAFLCARLDAIRTTDWLRRKVQAISLMVDKFGHCDQGTSINSGHETLF